MFWENKELVDPDPIGRINWRAYWEEFKQVHGGPSNPPVPWQGRMLFCDGWSYGTKIEADRPPYSGPEYPPPGYVYGYEGPPKKSVDREKLRAMQRDYWTIRLGIVGKKHRELATRIAGLRELQHVRSATLQMVRNERVDGQLKTYKYGLDLEIAVQRLGLMQDEIDECISRIESLGGAVVDPKAAVR